MILGLDISTSSTGWSIIDKDGILVDQGFIDLSKKKTLFEKAKVVKNKLVSLQCVLNIQKVFIEENLQAFRSGFSSAKTISTLAKFNGIVSYICFEEFYLDPQFLNVNSARKSLNIKIEREKICGVSTKQQVLNWTIEQLSNTSYEWPVKILRSGPRKGMQIQHPACFDIADAYVIAQSGFKMNK